MGRSLNLKGKAVFGDLIFENEKKKVQFIENCFKFNREKLVEEIEDEFFWNVKSTTKILPELGFPVITKQFSELSWGIYCKKNN
jgi:hypothetical protein